MLREAAFLLVIGVAFATVGAATSLSFTSASLGGASATVPRCTSGALTVTPNLSGTNIASVTVSGLPGACGNASAQAAVNNGTTSGSGSGTVPAAGGSVTISLGTAQAAASAVQIELLLTGP